MKTGWIIHLRPLKHDVPPYVRLRRLLKIALRLCGMKVISVTEIKEPE